MRHAVMEPGNTSGEHEHTLFSAAIQSHHSATDIASLVHMNVNGSAMSIPITITISYL